MGIIIIPTSLVSEDLSEVNEFKTLGLRLKHGRYSVNVSYYYYSYLLDSVYILLHPGLLA